MKIALAICLLLAGTLAAHPLDDKADMTSEITLLDDARFELAIEFRYKDVRASYAEFAGGLDRNQDGRLTADELEQRYVELTDQLALAITVNIGGKPARLEPDRARFRFQDLNDPEQSVDLAGGMKTSSSRIMYHFAYIGRPAGALRPGDNAVEYFFSGPQTVVHTPALQMLPFDGRGPRVRIEGATWDWAHGGLPRVNFNWLVQSPPDSATSADSAPQPSRGPQAIGEVPAWLTLASGVVLGVCGLIVAARRLLTKPRGRALGGLMMLLCGVAIVLGALMRLGLIGRL